MANDSRRFLYAGHALGLAAQFDRLDEATNLNHVIPVLGSSVLPTTGGRAEAHVDPYRYDVDQPRRRCLISVDRIETWAEGRAQNGGFQTEVSVEISGLRVVEKLHIDRLVLHMLSTTDGSAEPVVTTQGNRIEGMRLGNVEVRVTLDDEPLANAGSDAQLAAYYRKTGKTPAQAGEYLLGSLAREIRLVGAEQDKQGMSVDGDTIVWTGPNGMGKVILGEIHVKGHDRRLTLVRLAMGSDAGGTGTAGGGQSNGTTTGG